MIINEGLICLDYNALKKEDIIKKSCEMAYMSGKLSGINEFYEAVKRREEELSTDMGFGIAVPHGKTDAVKEAFVVFIRLNNEMIWDKAVGSKVKVILVLGAPEHSEDNVHLKILSQLAAKLMDEGFLEVIKNVKDKKTIMGYFQSIQK